MLRFSVKGMTCGHCAGSVKAAIQSVVPGATVRVDLRKATVEVDRGEVQVIKSAIEEAGYAVVSQAA